MRARYPRFDAAGVVVDSIERPNRVEPKGFVRGTQQIRYAPSTSFCWASSQHLPSRTWGRRGPRRRHHHCRCCSRRWRRRHRWTRRWWAALATTLTCGTMWIARPCCCCEHLTNEGDHDQRHRHVAQRVAQGHGAVDQSTRGHRRVH